MAAARESLNREQIAAASGLDAEEDLPVILSRLASFVPASEGRYAFFHKSLSDWLTGWDNRQDQPFAGPYHLNLQKGWIRLANWCWAEYQRGSLNISSYCLRHLPAHLHQVGRDEALRNVLSDFNFLQRKLEATDARALIADYEYLPEGADLRLVHSAVRLSAHVLARDQRQLAGQLTGRLLGNPAPIIQALLKGAAESRSWPWLRPLTPSLAPPGGPMIRTFEGHTALGPCGGAYSRWGLRHLGLVGRDVAGVGLGERPVSAHARGPYGLGHAVAIRPTAPRRLGLV